MGLTLNQGAKVVSLSALDTELRTIAPEWIIALGDEAARYMELPNEDYGIVHQIKGICVIATHHPSHLIENPTAKKMCWAHLQLVMSKASLPGAQK
jgi:uracil-DNA glycosylase